MTTISYMPYFNILAYFTLLILFLIIRMAQDAKHDTEIYLSDNGILIRLFFHFRDFIRHCLGIHFQKTDAQKMEEEMFS